LIDTSNSTSWPPPTSVWPVWRIDAGRVELLGHLGVRRLAGHVAAHAVRLLRHAGV
jgi:hypothetical protein